MWKKILAWTIAIIVSFIVVRMIIRIVFLTFSFALTLMTIVAVGIPVLILSLPVYLIIKKKFLK